MHIWMGECHVHAGISPVELRDKALASPESELFIHPECGCATPALWLSGTGDLPAERTHVLSTGGMLDRARDTKAKSVLVATETGMLHQLRRANPAVRWEPVNENAECVYMKMTTRDVLLQLPARGNDRSRRRTRDRASRAARGRRHDRGGHAVDGGRVILLRRDFCRRPVRRGTREADVVVVGTGAAGLSAALTLASSGRRVVVLAKGDLTQRLDAARPGRPRGRD